MKTRGLWFALAVSLLPLVAVAHHSFAMFNQEEVTELSGTVKDFQWTNPHAWLDIVVTDKSGDATVWGIEMNGPGGLYREGWRSDSVKPGDQVTLQIHPLRDGRPGGSLVSATLPNGKHMVEMGGAPRPAGAAR